METNSVPARPALRLVILAWLAMIGFDFLLHGGVLARYYIEPSDFLLSPERAFQLIPLGYLSFLALAVLCVWLMRSMDVTGTRSGALFGLKLGALVWGSLTLGLLSISTADPTLMIGWFLGQSIALCIAGGFVGSALAGAKLSKLFWKVLALILGCAIVTVALQALGLAPAITT